MTGYNLGQERLNLVHSASPNLKQTTFFFCKCANIKPISHEILRDKAFTKFSKRYSSVLVFQF